MVLNPQNRKIKIISYFLYKTSKLNCFLRIPAGSRLIKKKQVRVCGKRTRNFEMPLFTVRKIACSLVFYIFKTKNFQKLINFFSVSFFFLCIKHKCRSKKIGFSVKMLGNKNIFKNREIFPKSDILKSSCYSELCYLIGSRLNYLRIFSEIAAFIQFFHFAVRMI